MQYVLIRARVVNHRAVGITRPGEVRAVVLARQDIPSLVRWSFLLFAFTLPFQVSDLSFMSGSLSLARISGLLLFAFYFYYHNPLSRERTFPAIPAAMWCFVAYVVVYALNGFFVAEDFFYAFRSGLITLVQLIVLFWCAAGLFTEETITKNFFLTYSIAAGIFALGMILQIPGFSMSAASDPDVRISALGANPNTVAGVMAVAAVVLIGLYLNSFFKHFTSKILLIVLILILMVAMVKTGSRGGVLAFMIGCLTYSVPVFLKSKRKWVTIALVSLFTVAAVYLVVSNPMFSERVQQSSEGSFSNREVIFSAAMDMILERPLLGWRPIELWYELAARIGWPEMSDAHNLFLHLLLEVGLAGAIPFFVGLWLCGWGAWKARSGNLGLIAAALFLTLVANNMSGTGILEKNLWLVLALGVAAERSVARRSRKRFAVLLKDAPLRSGHENFSHS